MFSYRTILKQAFNLSWKNKHLWFFGLFASLTIAGGSLEYQFITQNFGQGVTNSSYQGLDNLLWLASLGKAICLGIIDLFSQNIIIILNSLSIILLAATLLSVFIWLAISSQAAIVNTSKQIITSKKKVYSPDLRASLAEGSQYFWTVLSLNVLIRILISVAFFISSLPLLFMIINESYSFVVIYTILFVIFVIIAVSLSLIVKYAISFNVLENTSLVTSLEKGYALFKKNWLISLEVAILLFLISILSSFVLLLIIAITIFPLLITGLVIAANWLTFLMIFIGIMIVILFGSFLTTFQITSWTNLYLHLKANKGQSKLERIFQKK